MTASAGSGTADPRRLLLVAPTPLLVAAVTEAGFPFVTVADTAVFTDEELRAHLRDTVLTHRVGRLIACGDASTHPVVLETAEELGVSPNPASAARLLADATEVRNLLNRSGPPWQALALQEEPGSRPPLCDVVYGLETLTVEGMHRVTGILEYRFGDRRVSDRREPDTGNGPGAERAAGDDATMSQGIGLALHTFPAPITGPEEAEIRALATGLLDLVGYEFGYAFTRIARTEQGPRVLDAVPRQASWPASRLIELTTGLVAERELVHALSGKPLKAAMPVGYAAAVPLPDPPGAPGRITAPADVRETRDGYHLLTALTPAELTARTAAVLGCPV
ncbi:hypothetical protein OH828_18525 [Streptomyces anulatus]|uniref:hypothetical protein n=1 Tax=Streptomyces TaxID=1883 RepID=UPI000851AD13|nr:MULTISPECIES: hypothetical protein [unclassified Streptomyces]MDQ0697117.1 hypothetical protein [Streptomyces sp. W4I9-2]UPT43433.1 hypothetical protein MWG59_19750 [Streptomyces sp. WAC00303]WTF62871.1 hypothetical protein OH791_18255 [Streptomyces anulatus]